MSEQLLQSAERQSKALETPPDPGHAAELPSDANCSEMDAILRALRKQSLRQKLFGGASNLLGGLLGFVIILSLVAVITMSFLDHAWPHVTVDLSLAGFGGTGSYRPGHRAEFSMSGITPTALMLGAFWFSRLARSERRKLSRSIFSYEDLRTVGPLIEALSLRDPELTRDASTKLLHLLPQLSEQQVDLLTKEQREAMRAYLLVDRVRLNPANHLNRGTFLSAPNRELTIAFFRALQPIGNEKDLELARQFGPAHGADVQEAAQACACAIEARLARQRAPQVLLRPAAESPCAAITLLRAAHGAGSSDLDSLLRASSDGTMTT